MWILHTYYECSLVFSFLHYVPQIMYYIRMISVYLKCMYTLFIIIILFFIFLLNDNWDSSRENDNSLL